MMIRYTLLALFLGCCFPVLAQTPIAPLSPAEQRQVIDSVAKRMSRSYIYPEMAQKMNQQLLANANKGAYKPITGPAAFAAKLREDMVAVSGDKHLNITFDPEWVRASRKVLSSSYSLELIHRDFPNARADNFGFKEVRILDGNIGYLNLTKFYDPALGGETAAAAMNFLTSSDALVIDLRNNGGGYGDMVQLVASYLFSTEQVLILELYSRETGISKQDWTLPFVPGKRMAEKPVYLLTGPGTFSAAESFAYFLKNRKRATLIGQSTGGGAHPIHHQALNERFTIFVPYGRPIDPVTKTDWEGVGVIPDIAAKAEDALLVAQVTALERLLASQPENAGALWALQPLRAKMNPVEISPVVLQSYAGNYASGARKLLLENGKFYFQRTGQPRYALVALSQDLFMVEEIPYLRIKMNLDKGKVTGFSRLYNDGSSFLEARDGDN